MKTILFLVAALFFFSSDGALNRNIQDPASPVDLGAPPESPTESTTPNDAPGVPVPSDPSLPTVEPVPTEFSIPLALLNLRRTPSRGAISIQAKTPTAQSTTQRIVIPGEPGDTPFPTSVMGDIPVALTPPKDTPTVLAVTGSPTSVPVNAPTNIPTAAPTIVIENWIPDTASPTSNPTNAPTSGFTRNILITSPSNAPTARSPTDAPPTRPPPPTFITVTGAPTVETADDTSTPTFFLGFPGAPTTPETPTDGPGTPPPSSSTPGQTQPPTDSSSGGTTNVPTEDSTEPPVAFFDFLKDKNTNKLNVGLVAGVVVGGVVGILVVIVVVSAIIYKVSCSESTSVAPTFENV